MKKTYLTTRNLPKFNNGANSLELRKARNLNNSLEYDNNLPVDNSTLQGATGLASLFGTSIINNYDKNTDTDVLGNEITTESKWGTAGKGAIQGAAAGSLFGPIGAVAGAVAGGAYGYFSNDEEEKANEQKQKAKEIKRDLSTDTANQTLQQFQNAGYNPTGQQGIGMYKKGGRIMKFYGNNTTADNDISKYPQGGPVKPTFVTNRNDPRLTSYNDSLSEYENFIANVELAKRNGRKFTGTTDRSAFATDYKGGVQQPTGFAVYTHPDPNYALPTEYIGIHKKPVQPVVYQKPISASKNTSQSSKPKVESPKLPSDSLTNYNNFLKASKEIENVKNGDFANEEEYTKFRKNLYDNVYPTDFTKLNTSGYTEPKAVKMKDSSTVYFSRENAKAPMTPPKPVEKPKPGDTNYVVPTWHQGYRNWQKGIKPGLYAEGGSIHINPANKGKFNALKERTGKSTEELTHSKNPLTRKRAIFAQNFAHALGGNLYKEGQEYDLSEQEINKLKKLGYQLEY